MKVVVSLRPLKSGSKNRGIGVYTRELLDALRKTYPDDTFIPTTKDYYDTPADLVHLPFFDPFYLTMPLKLTRPTVVTIHDLIPLKFPAHFQPGLRGRLKWLVQRYAVKKANHILTDSNASKADIMNILGIPEEKITVVPLGPNRSERIPPAMAERVARRYHLPARYLLYVGDINWNKNVPGLIKMFGVLKDPKLHLVLVGKAFTDKPNIPEYLAVRKAIAACGCADRIHELGYAPSHHLSVLYSRATLYVQPSWYEGFGLTVLEAMKFGCPVASSRLGSLPEVGGEAVAYFDPGKDMGEVVSSLLKSPAKRRALSAAGKLQAAGFTWKRTAQATYAVYENILANAR